MKKLVFMLLMGAFLCYLACFILVSNTSVPTFKETEGPGRNGKVPEENNIKIESNYRIREAELLDFIRSHFLGVNGEIATNLEGKGKNETLSESVGLFMQYCVIRDRKELFDREFSFLKNRMMVNGCFVRWKCGDAQTTCNSAIDDLRIISALLDGYEKWHESEYFNTAGFIQQGIFEKQTGDCNLYPLYDWKSGAACKVTPVCYYDLYTMDRLRVFNTSWMAIEDSCIGIIQNGSEENMPFFKKYYNPESEKYEQDEELKENRGVCLTYSLYTALHLAQVNEEPGCFSDWLRSEMSKGKLYAWYNPYTLRPAQDMESTAIYALASLYSRKVGERSLARQLLDRMLQFEVEDPGSAYYGGFGNKDTGDFYSFDNLMALLALADAEN